VSTETRALPHETIWTVTNAVTAARALHVVAELGVADRIDAVPVPVDQLAAECGVNAGALDRLLRLLVAHGIFEREAERCMHNEASRLLRRDHPASMSAFARMMALPVFWASFGALDHAVRTGATAIETVDPGGLWAHLRAHPEEARIFDEAMTARSRSDVATIIGSYDFEPFSTIADIGGGRGHLLRAVLDSVPTAKGVLFDLPGVIESLDAQGDRLIQHPGDFFVDPLPCADAYVLMEVLHDWADAEATAILRAIRRAASPGATVLIIEGIVPEDGNDVRVHTLDVIMLAVTGGRERTARQLGVLLETADLRLSAVIETAGPMRVVEAVAI
jgi:C-methyltransferase